MENRTYNFEEVTNYVNLKICAEPGKEKGTYIGLLKKKSKNVKIMKLSLIMMVKTLIGTQRKLKSPKQNQAKQKR